MPNHRKPTALRLLAGNPGKRPLNELEPEPDVLEGIPDPPDWLKFEGKREWYRLVPALVNTRVITHHELSALAHLCYMHWKLVETAEAREMPSAALLAQYRSLIAEFGLTPASRTKIKVLSGEKDDPKAKKFFG